ncbi:MAG: hypothetical protein DSY77_07110 [Bacteroidetes bacterium]|nr:MAG: hypothetical protein DSY77_07110 [Bacteroidota bacterium]
MRKISILVILVVLIVTSCKDSNIDPSCLNDKINELEDISCEDGVQITLYEFQGQNVYLLELGNCIADGSTEVVDASCRTLGFLGGLAGSNEIDGLDFYENAIFIEVVWEK